MGIIFGSLYLIGIISGFTVTNDIWSNLFAAVIAVLLIDRLVKRIELQKSDRSIKYVKQRIANICTSIISSMNPPKDWRLKLENEDYNWHGWNDYLNCAKNEVKNSLEESQIIMDRFSFFMEPDLRNDFFDLVNLLVLMDAKMYAKISADSVTIENRKKDANIVKLRELFRYADEACGILDHALFTMKRHKLLEAGRAFFHHYRKGKPPLVKPVHRADLDYPKFEIYLQESVSFKDQLYKQAFGRV